jgi:hypothetical protein
VRHDKNSCICVAEDVVGAHAAPANASSSMAIDCAPTVIPTPVGPLHDTFRFTTPVDQCREPSTCERNTVNPTRPPSVRPVSATQLTRGACWEAVWVLSGDSAGTDVSEAQGEVPAAAAG